MTIEELKDKVIGEIPHRWEHARARAENHLDKLLEQVAKEQREICYKMYRPGYDRESNMHDILNAPSPLDRKENV